MRTQLSKFFGAIGLLVVFFFIACSGGGDTPPPPPPPTVHSISGSVSGAVSAGVTVSLNPGNTIVTTGTNGAFSFTGLSNGTYTVTPSRVDFTFSPVTTTVTLNGTDKTGVNFSATATPTSFTISGVTTAGTLVTLTGTATGSTTASTGGNYSFTNLAPGTYTLTPSLAGYTFSPVNAVVNLTNADRTDVNFLGTVIPPNTYSISGTVSGGNIAGVLINAGASYASVLTNANGTYTITGLQNGIYSIVPFFTGVTFTPQVTQVVISGANVAGIDFVGTVPQPSVPGKILYVAGENIYSKDLTTGAETNLAWLPPSTTIDAFVPLRGNGQQVVYRSPGTQYPFNGIFTFNLVDHSSVGNILAQGIEAPGYPTTTFGSFDVGLDPLYGNFAVVTLHSDSGKSDIFAILMTGPGQYSYFQITSDGVNSSPVITNVNSVNGDTTVLFIKNGTEIWKQIYNQGPVGQPGSFIGPAALFMSSVFDSTRPMSVSADYTQLAFTKNVAGVSHIVTISVTGGTEVDLGAGSNPAWLLDGTNRIQYTVGNALWVMNADGTNRMLVPLPTNLSLSDLSSVVFGPQGF